ncbi:MAG: alpha/beta hydrolase [Acidobacteria bacterium]|nr:alpha/beta hydrolase [Acidobacteriota bacterium]
MVQRVEFRNSRGLRLAGEFYRAGSNSTVVMAHGFTSDRSSSGRFPLFASALNRAGYDALAFDFTGCGESDNETLTMGKQTEDLHAAVQFAYSYGLEHVALLGNSLGGLVCLRAYSPDIVTMVLLGAATGPVHYQWDAYFSPEQMRELRVTGRITIHKTEGARRWVVVERQLLLDFEQIDQPQLLSAVNCPVLLIHGDDDDEERQLLLRSRQGMEYLPPGSRLEVIQGAGHGFRSHLDAVVQLLLGWVQQHMPI